MWDPNIIECCNPDCSNSDLREAGAPAPVGWFDLTRWTGTQATGYSFCSFDCLRTTISVLEFDFGNGEGT
jgi:hypothetical protein